MFKQISTVVLAALLSATAGQAMAQAASAPAKPAAPAAAAAPAAPAAPAAAGDCEKQAADKKLHGAAKNSFVKKCSGGAAAGASCEAKALSKDGKPLAGAAKASFVKKCEAGAK